MLPFLQTMGCLFNAFVLLALLSERISSASLGLTTGGRQSTHSANRADNSANEKYFEYLREEFSACSRNGLCPSIRKCTSSVDEKEIAIEALRPQQGSCSLVIEDDHSPTECLLQLTYTLAYARRDVRREVCNANMLLCGLLDSAKREAASHFSSKIHRRGGCTSSQFIIRGHVSLSNVILASFDVESCNEVDLTKGWPRIASHLAPVPNISVIPDLELKVSFSVKEYGNLGVSLAVSSDDERNGDVPRPLSLTTFEYVQEKLNSSISGCHKMDAGLIEMAYSPDTLVVGDWLLDVLTQVLSTTNFSNTNLSGDRHLGKRSAQTQPPEAGHCELQQFQVHNSDIHNFHVNPHPLPSSYQGHTPTGRPRILYPKWLKLNYCQGRHGLHYYGKQDKLAAYSQLLATSINGEHIGYTPRCLPFTYAPILLVVSNINVLNPTVIANDLQVASCHWQ